jgi:hypothetical protein
MDKCFNNQNTNSLLQTLNSFGNMKRREKRLQKSMGKLKKTNSHLVHFMNFDKENYFLNLKNEKNKST